MPNKNNLENIYLKIIEYGTYLALFSPFILVKDYFFPFVTPKTVFFRIIVDVIFIAYILLAVSNPKYRPRINALTATITVFLAILVLTSFTGINFERSFWSVFERMTGLLTFLHLYVFFIILSSVFKERKCWEKILTVSILVGVLICFYVWTPGGTITRGGGTLGNTSFLSAYLIFSIFFAIILLFTKKGWWKVCYGLSLVIMLSAFFFNQEPTRGAIGPFFGGVFLLILGYMVFSGKKLLKRLAPVLLILVVLAGIGFSRTNFFKEKIINLEDVPGRDREIIWQMGVEAWQEKFWLGWGLENFNVPFIKYYDPELPLTGEIWYDRIHNIVLDMAVASGIIGLISYLAIFGVAVFGLLRICSKVAERKNIFFPLGMIVLLMVYFAQNIWVFDMVSSYLMFFLSLAFVGFLIFPEDEEENKQKVIPLPSFVAGLLIVLTIFTFYFGNIQSARASKFILKGIAYPLEQSIPMFQKAFKASPMTKFEAPEQFSMKISTLAAQANQNKELLNQGFKLAEEEFKNAILQNPLDFRLHLFLGKHYNNFYQFTGDEEKLLLAEKSLERALELGPTNQQVYFIFAQTRFLQGKQEKAIEFLQKAKELEPRFFWSGWYLARGYRVMGKYDLALSELKEAENLGFDWQGNIETLKEGIEMLKEAGEDVNLLIPLYENGIELNPQDIYLWEALINAYINTGKKEKAKMAAEKFLEIKPEFAPQVEQLLKDLGY